MSKTTYETPSVFIIYDGDDDVTTVQQMRAVEISGVLADCWDTEEPDDE